MSSHDVIVVGAGVSGLAALRDLRAHGLDAIVLEAQPRIGGRVHTLHPPESQNPVELGAEFLHGEATETEKIARAAGLRAYDVAGDHWAHERGALRRRKDYWARIGRVLNRIDAREHDRSFAEFLADGPGGRAAAADRKAARDFVEGFHAADVDRISMRSLNEGNPGQERGAARLGRIAEGYAAVANALAAPVRDRIRGNAAVRRIAWRRGAVEVVTARKTFTARAAIVTVPLGVLQAEPGSPGAIEFDPPLTAKRSALELLAMGSVARVSLAFDEPFWAARNRNLQYLSFLHTPAAPIKVWWTALPMRAPLLVGWAGGPPARALLAAGADALLDTALRTLGQALGGRATVKRHLTGWWTHDWDADPFSRGAYSYPLVGGNEAASRLARSLDNTLFFAGEAADAEGRNGTVDGAIGAGRKAARKLASAMR